MELTAEQQAAIAYIEKKAISRDKNALRTIESFCLMGNIAAAVYIRAIDNIRTFARVALHFHPDRLTPENYTVAESLLTDGFYKNQFETKLSNGHLEPVKGGTRDIWENNLFGSSYVSADHSLSKRPKYGALDLMHHADGPSPRFGSCYFLLNPDVSRRCTFTYMDSHKNPLENGTLNHFNDIFGALATECFERNFALGIRGITPSVLMSYLANDFPLPFRDPSALTPSGNLDHYIEAQVHGPVNLETDAEILVADPSFKQTPVGDHLAKLCNKYKIELYWHAGFSLDTAEIPSDFRGRTMPSLGARIAENGWINAFCIGEAAKSLKLNPENWKDRGSCQECLQELKLLWHVLVKFGKPVMS
jgi:hypothetical protein